MEIVEEIKANRLWRGYLVQCLLQLAGRVAMSKVMERMDKDENLPTASVAAVALVSW